MQPARQKRFRLLGVHTHHLLPLRASERAVQIWPILTLASFNRQVLIYDFVGRLIGVPRQGLGQLLEPIQSYCLLHKLPALTTIVVSQESGMPGTGFIAAQDIPAEQARVFRQNWLERACPTAADLNAAVTARQSNGVPTLAE